MSQPNLNVTPLIDILLVLLIIFMVISPLKPSSFKAKIPSEPKSVAEAEPPPLALVVSLREDSSLELNNQNNLGTVDDAQKMTAKLQQIFAERKNNQVISVNTDSRKDFTSPDAIERTVFIKAPKNLAYGKIVKVIDAVKLAGASPIGLQIDGLNSQ